MVPGTIELNEHTTSLSVTSAARAERGKALLSAALTDLIAPPLSKIEAVAQIRATARPGATQPDADIPPEVQAELVHAMLDRQYRALLDEPVAMPGGVSSPPRSSSPSSFGSHDVTHVQPG